MTLKLALFSCLAKDRWLWNWLCFPVLFCIEKYALTGTDFESGVRFSVLSCIEKETRVNSMCKDRWIWKWLYFPFLFCIEKHVLTVCKDTDFESSFRLSVLFCIQKHVLTGTHFESGFRLSILFCIEKYVFTITQVPPIGWRYRSVAVVGCSHLSLSIIGERTASP